MTSFQRLKLLETRDQFWLVCRLGRQRRKQLCRRMCTVTAARMTGTEQTKQQGAGQGLAAEAVMSQLLSPSSPETPTEATQTMHISKGHTVHDYDFTLCLTH